jgi:uncharacterized protein YaaQ
MKMIIAIFNDDKRHVISQALIEEDYRVTQLATTSRFLRGGETSLMIGVNDDQVEKALQIIRDQLPPLSDPEEKQATIYVLSVKDFNRL